MTTLGIGVRVYIGFINDPENKEPNPQLQTGTIVDGPIAPLSKWKNFRTPLLEPGWEVHIDNWKNCAICERFLFPLDDWDEGIKEEKEKESPKHLEIVR